MTSTSSRLSLLHPAAPSTLEESGLSFDLVMQLVLKTLHFGGELSGADLSRRLGLEFPVLEPCLEFLKQERQCEISGGSVFGSASYRFRITDMGRSRAALFLDQNKYVGVAPVPVTQYRRYLTEFRGAASSVVSRDDVREAFAHLVVRDAVIDQVGPAINSGQSMFVYGSPGNGKTMLAQAIRKLLPGDIAIPHALDVEGNIVRLFDPVKHEELPSLEEEDGLTIQNRSDRRWVRCRRPLVMVGGELTLEALELGFSAQSGFYRAPVQVLANGGVLVIDDFGRQQCRPTDLLNRWIVPLESRVDFLTLQSGQVLEVPFMVVLVFATNLKPSDLVDEAFLRRIPYKIFAESPTAEDFIRIFENCCHAKQIPFDRSLVEAMLQNVYRPNKIPLRGCQPRDLINQALALADYSGQPRRLTAELLDAACRSYFVQDKEVEPTYA